MTDREFWEWCGWEYTGVTNSAIQGLVYAPRDTWRFLLSGETTILSPTSGKPRVIPAVHETFYAEKRGGSLPVDLNNLFKYAVPKLDYMALTKQTDDEFRSWYMAEVRYHSSDNLMSEAHDKDPALALRKAIEQIIEEAK